jgi:hypothetical protein
VHIGESGGSDRRRAAAAAGTEFQIFGGIRQNYVLSDPLRIHGNFSNLSEDTSG